MSTGGPTFRLRILSRTFKPVHVGQHQVEHHQVVVRRVEMVQSGGAVERRVHGISGPLQTAAQEVRDPLFVLHDQDSHLLSA